MFKMSECLLILLSGIFTHLNNTLELIQSDSNYKIENYIYNTYIMSGLCHVLKCV